MSEEKEWKIGEYCYIFPKTQQETDKPMIFKRLPFKITDILEGGPRIFVLRTIPINNTVGDVTRNIQEGEYMEYCSEENFKSFVASILENQVSEIQELEMNLQRAKKFQLETQALLQELGIKIN